jgi:hypothetical protein
MDDLDIWLASGTGLQAMVKRLVGQDPGLLDARDDLCSRTPLIRAAEGGHVGVVRWLLDAGAAINKVDSRRCTALWPSVARLLMEAEGGRPHHRRSVRQGLTPLMMASKRGGPPRGRARTARPRQRQGQHQPTRSFRRHGAVRGLLPGPWGRC